MGLRRPTNNELAFALTVVKHKDPGTSYEDFFHFLRQHIHAGRLNVSREHYLDGVEFWKARYATAEMENTRLKAESAVLHKSLKESQESTQATTTRKRQRGTDRSVELERCVDNHLAALRTILDSPVRQAVDCLCLLHHAKDFDAGLSAIDKYKSALMTLLRDESTSHMSLEDLDRSSHLFQTISKRFTSTYTEADQSLRLDRCRTEFLVSLLSAFNARMDRDLRRRRRHEGERVDWRPVISSLASFLISHITLLECKMTIFAELVACVRKTLDKLYRSTRQHDEVIVRDGGQYFLALLIALGDIDDTESRYEQHLVRHFVEMGEFEKEVWALGVWRNWIRFV